jgi:anti-repressor protein
MKENIANKMQELIKIKVNDEGKQLVSLRELYKGLGLQRTNFNSWVDTNVLKNDFFKEDIDWTWCMVNIQGNECKDFAISLEFAKHLAMMARTKKSHEYRNYFIECEKKTKEVKQLSSMEILELQVAAWKEQKKEIKEVKDDLNNFKIDIPLFNIECDELQREVKKIGMRMLGGKTSPAYKDNSLRAKLYKDIQNQIKREFGLNSYKAIKRSQLDVAKELVKGYKVPIVLKDEIVLLNNQIKF